MLFLILWVVGSLLILGYLESPRHQRNVEMKRYIRESKERESALGRRTRRRNANIHAGWKHERM